jgi:ATP-dependent Lhr-like helicase
VSRRPGTTNSGSQSAAVTRVDAWFASRNWQPFDFQRQTWSAYLEGRSGLIHSPTGTGKTQAAWLGPVIEALAHDDTETNRLRVLWVTPLRALAHDTASNLREPLEQLNIPWTVELRTGETSSAIKARQRTKPPSCLVTTPESLSVLLSYADCNTLFRHLRCIVSDEWHELMGSKRGVQAELGFARLRALAPGVRTWGVSATLGNTDEAMRVLLGSRSAEGELVAGHAPKAIEIETLIPARGVDSYPWYGHLGLHLVDQVIDRIRAAGTTLLFTNTRSQAELWFKALNTTADDLLGSIALHHGSLDRSIRAEVERLLRAEGEEKSKLRCVVCTSSLDLGVDFTPVDQVIQIGSPKGVARLVQRAGRSGHRPGAVSRIVGVPTHALELVEFAAARAQVERAQLEARMPIDRPLDVLAQHVVTAAMGGGFVAQDLLAEARSTHAFEHMTDDEWSWVMDFVRRGGDALTAYPRFARIMTEREAEAREAARRGAQAAEGVDGQPVQEPEHTLEPVTRADTHGPTRWVVASQSIARSHRMSIGTILSDDGVLVKYLSGKTLGSIEESFISRLRPGQKFIFAGRVLVFERLRDMTAWVRRATSPKGAVPRWNGGRMPLSTQLADAVQELFAAAGDGMFNSPEMQAIRPLLERQQRDSALPTPGRTIIEQLDLRDGRHFFIYTFAGRLTNEGLGSVLATRLARIEPVSVRSTATDYGIELHCETRIDIDEPTWRRLLDPQAIIDDLLESLNTTEIARRHFREIARIAGLTQQGIPGTRVPTRLMQASSEMYYDVFTEFDPGNMLLTQTRREVLESQLELQRLTDALERVASGELMRIILERLTPLAFPLFADGLRATTVSSESWESRIRRIAGDLQRGADAADLR